MLIIPYSTVKVMQIIVAFDDKSVKKNSIEDF